MKTRILTGLLFSVAVVAFLVPGFWTPLIPLLFFALVAVMGAGEMNNALRARDPGIGSVRYIRAGVLFGILSIPVSIRLYAGLAGQAAGEAYASDWTEFVLQGARTLSVPPILLPALLLVGFATAVFLFSVIIVFGIFVDVLRRGTGRIGPAGAAAAGAAYVALPFFCAVAMLFTLQDAMFWVIPALVAPWVTDVTAYFTGSFFGKHRIVPGISPKKTWEGCIGGMLGCMAAMPAWIFLAAPSRESVPDVRMALFALTIGMLAGIVAQAGDWFASAIKRWCGIKDFGTLLPGHGGILDRFDSVLFTMPLFFAAAVVFENL